MLYWFDGTSTPINGFDITDAFFKSGINSATLMTLDYWDQL